MAARLDWLFECESIAVDRCIGRCEWHEAVNLNNIIELLPCLFLGYLGIGLCKSMAGAKDGVWRGREIRVYDDRLFLFMFEVEGHCHMHIYLYYNNIHRSISTTTRIIPCLHFSIRFRSEIWWKNVRAHHSFPWCAYPKENTALATPRC